MQLTWLDPVRPDPAALAGAVAVLEANRVVQTPHRPAVTVSGLAGTLRNGWDGVPPVNGVAQSDAGVVVGVLEMWLPTWENTHLGVVQVTVDPALRRQGVGRFLYEHGVARLRAEGRTLLVGDGHDEPAATGFATAMGLVEASVQVYRYQDVPAVDRAAVDAAYAEAAAAASGYELVRIGAHTPPDLLDAVARMSDAINDAPIDDLELDQRPYTPDRVRGWELAQEGRGRTVYRLVARERATGELAGQTLVAVERDQPWFCWQFDTSVLRTHRGHRLGLLLKAGLLGWLREAEPQVRRVHTDNAESNAHMIRINERLGYVIAGRYISWQARLG